MSHELDNQPLLTFAHDGKLVHAELVRRLAAIGSSLNKLAIASGVAFSTLDRWRLGADPTVPKMLSIERTLKRMEGVDVAVAHHSNISGVSPSACL